MRGYSTAWRQCFFSWMQTSHVHMVPHWTRPVLQQNLIQGNTVPCDYATSSSKDSSGMSSSSLQDEMLTYPKTYFLNYRPFKNFHVSSPIPSQLPGRFTFWNAAWMECLLYMQCLKVLENTMRTPIHSLHCQYTTTIGASSRKPCDEIACCGLGRW